MMGASVAKYMENMLQYDKNHHYFGQTIKSSSALLFKLEFIFMLASIVMLGIQI